MVGCIGIFDLEPELSPEPVQRKGGHPAANRMAALAKKLRAAD